MTDLLKHLYVDVHCNQCGDFAISADVIAESQRLLASGCPGSAYECPPELFATLLEPSALESLQRAWSHLEEATRNPARRVSINDGHRVSVEAADELDSKAISRWEDDGGYSLENAAGSHHAPKQNRQVATEDNS